MIKITAAAPKLSQAVAFAEPMTQSVAVVVGIAGGGECTK